MSSTIGIFMQKEFTCLPSLFEKYVSKHYNNALGNALSWCFFIWIIIHLVFERFINALLRGMKYPEYIRNRIVQTLWSFGFCMGSFMYCFIALKNNNFNVAVFTNGEIFSVLPKDVDVVPSQNILGFIIISTYQAQQIFWEGYYGVNKIAFNYIMLFLFASSTYLMGWTDLLFVFVAVTSFVQCILELGKTFSLQMNNQNIMIILSWVFFALHLVLCFFLYFVVIPLYFLVPCGKIFCQEIQFILFLINITLWIWFIINISNSALSKIVKHFIFHVYEEENSCDLDILDCCMFPVRTDTAYSVMVLKREIEAGRVGMEQPRKRSSRALFQTLKCVMAVKRKLKKRRRTLLFNGGNFDPTVDSENSEAGTSSPQDSDNDHSVASEDLDETTALSTSKDDLRI